MSYTQCWAWEACFIKDRSRAFRSAEPSRRVELEDKGTIARLVGRNKAHCFTLYLTSHQEHKGDRQPPIAFSPLSPDSLSDVPLSLRLYSLHHARFLADMTFVTNRDEGHLTWLVIEVARNINHMHQVYNCLLKIWGTDPLPAFPQNWLESGQSLRLEQSVEPSLPYIFLIHATLDRSSVISLAVPVLTFLWQTSGAR